MEIILFIGLQASGKSTFYHHFFDKTHLHLSMDMLKTRYRENIFLHACIKGKQNVVVDNTNPTTKERERYIQLFSEAGFKIVAYYFELKLDECLARNAKRNGKKCIPEVGLKGTFNKLELPQYDEGFDEIYYVKMVDNEFCIEKWKNEI